MPVLGAMPSCRPRAFTAHRAGIAGPGLLARVLSSKYAEHTRCTASLKYTARQGVELSRSLLSGWVDACCRLCHRWKGRFRTMC
ncbi:transposase [Klebsiella pneumoniae]